MAEAEEEPTVSMREILQDFIDLEREAEEKEKEHWGEESVCTYDKGYILQPVYACLTCSKACGKPVGVCYGCYLNCHLEHDTIELFYKHRFRCDCGTPRIPGFDCTLIKDDELHFYENDKNEYNHNFTGHFCWCDKFYNAGANTDTVERVCKKCESDASESKKGGDEDNEDDDSKMVQCVACEDWFHGKCIKSKNGPEYVAPEEDKYEDFVCDKCHDAYRPIFDKYPAIFFDSQEPLVAPAVCPFSSQAGEVKANFGKCLFLREGWSKALCRCAECTARYASAKHPWIFELEDESEKKGDPAVDNVQQQQQQQQPPPPPLPQSSSSSSSSATTAATTTGQITPTKLETQGIAAMGKSLTYTQQYGLFFGLKRFNESFKRFLTEKKDGVVTKQDVKYFYEDFKEREAKKRRNE